MYKLNYKKRVWIVKQFDKGVSPSKIAKAQGIHRRCVYQILDKYKAYGWEGLKDHKTGCPETVLNPKTAEKILDMRKQYGYSACHIEQILKKEGFSISHRQIEKLLIRNGLVEPIILRSRNQGNGYGMRCPILMTYGIQIGRMTPLLSNS